MVGWAIVLTLGLVSNLECICLKFENVFVQMELLTFGSVPISWLRCGAYGLMEGEGGGLAGLLSSQWGFSVPQTDKSKHCASKHAQTQFSFSQATKN